jgi:hypothetical protein
MVSLRAWRTTMKRAVLLGITASILSVCAVPSVHGHPGGLNAEGCHNNRKTGDYHCHRATQRTMAPQSVSSSGVVKKSRSGICHSSESPWYAATRNYQSFTSLRACLNSGGRLPRG